MFPLSPDEAIQALIEPESRRKSREPGLREGYCDSPVDRVAAQARAAGGQAATGGGKRSDDAQTSSLAAGARRVGSIVCFGVIPAFLMMAVLIIAFETKSFSFDFHGGLYNAAHAILHGNNPYRPKFVAYAASVLRAGGTPPAIDVPVYPPDVLLASAPLGLLSFKTAAVLFTLLSIAALVVALRLLDVHDWRCYGAAFASWLVISSLRMGALGLLLVLGAAVAWRWRDKTLPAAIAVAALIVAKLFPWTLAIWLLVTGRLRTFALTVLLAVVSIPVAWAVIDFHGMATYPRMLANLSFAQRGTGVSVVAGFMSVGTPAASATAASLLITAGLVVIAWRLSRRPDGDRLAFGLMVMTALTASPNVWPDYLVLVYVPIALISPTLSPIWLVPLLAYFAPVETGGKTALILPYIAIEAIVIARLCWPVTPRAAAQTVPPDAHEPAGGVLDAEPAVQPQT
jgi:hypothetical protein